MDAPPAQVASDLLADLLTVRQQLEMATPTQVVELQRIAAALASVHANALTRMGEHGAALRWWRTARQAADASGDLGLRLHVRSMEAGHGLYGQRDPETVLRLIESAERIAGGPTVHLSKGGVDAGMRQAAAVIETLPPTYRSHHVKQTGRMVLRAVPAGQRARKTVGEFREVLGVGAGSDGLWHFTRPDAVVW
ncbi:hypothetical protein [Microbispora bryophytorum]|uniref:hypothetical protein n=1 Tax=Microbispora bryophytorum TaxID=1460882 RepID=UPI0033D7733A